MQKFKTFEEALKAVQTLIREGKVPRIEKRSGMWRVQEETWRNPDREVLEKENG